MMSSGPKRLRANSKVHHGARRTRRDLAATNPRHFPLGSRGRGGRLVRLSGHGPLLSRAVRVETPLIQPKLPQGSRGPSTRGKTGRLLRVTGIDLVTATPLCVSVVNRLSQLRQKNQNPAFWLGCFREALQNRFPILNSSFNIAHSIRFCSVFGEFIFALFSIA